MSDQDQLSGLFSLKYKVGFQSFAPLGHYYLSVDQSDPQAPKVVMGEQPFYWQLDIATDDTDDFSGTNTISFVNASGDRLYLQRSEVVIGGTISQPIFEAVLSPTHEQPLAFELSSYTLADGCNIFVIDEEQVGLFPAKNTADNRVGFGRPQPGWVATPKPAAKID